MANSGQAVWLATENSCRVSLFHATSTEFLLELDVKNVVIQRLQCKSFVRHHGSTFHFCTFMHSSVHFGSAVIAKMSVIGF
ncbi:unnamed protein product [Protopolystoma xenopodis]|uniref:Uncharacterized protein n=1 Tax=Protopolystoma xenopodis TaxID=117903 RepID=A0A3S5FEL6_9PLAT|nr:unnamed protein product [Protopolystoma xenopodis]